MSKIDDLVQELDWMLPTTVQEDAVREALINAYNRALEDVYGRLCNSSKSYVLKYLETKLNID